MLGGGRGVGIGVFAGIGVRVGFVTNSCTGIIFVGDGDCETKS